MRAGRVLLLLAALGGALRALDPAKLRDGDILFQTSSSAQSLLIQLATRSEYTYMGVLFRNGGRWLVYEAVQPVKRTPVDAWVRRGAGGRAAVKRLKAPLPPAGLARMKASAARFLGRPYDLAFGWSDDRIYCSELVWKVYKEGAGVELGALQTLKDFDLSHPLVQAELRRRHPGPLPLEEPVISPQRIFESPTLETVDAD